MSGIVAIISKKDCKEDLFYATDYHSHLGTSYGGIAISDGKRTHKKIHSIAKAQFKSRFSEDIDFINMRGNTGIGVISDRDTQPLIMRLKFGEYAICGVGYINNQNKLAKQLIEQGMVFSEMPNGKVNQIELAAKLINKGKTIVDGIQYMHSQIDGSLSLLLLGKEGIYAARDKYGRSPLVLSERNGDNIVASETCSFKNLGFKTKKFLGPDEIVLLSRNKVKQIKKPGNVLQLCTFLYVYAGFPASEYEGKNVEEFREYSGRIIAKRDNVKIDFVAGVADSGTAYAHGYSHESGVPVRIPLLKYTPGWARSYVPPSQETRDLVALMKQVTADALIKGQKMVITEDSIVRGTQLKNFLLVKLWNAGAKEIHARPACPALMFPCKFLYSTRKLDELFARRILKRMHGGKHIKDVDPYLDPDSKEYKKMKKLMEKDLNVTSLRYQRLEDMLGATGLPEQSLCTYCWTGKEIA
ncbi:amidophosphoribosyltransferase [candidate division WOR-3 bacterium]|jgi:amidophosphoribosyltransferase|nr:amidophosphoribosyltransferase [candidate division WOR-3 bacterium]